MSRALDTQVAEKVMLWPHRQNDYDRHEWWEAPHFSYTLYGNNLGQGALPRFSNHIGDAMSVVDHLVSLGYRVRLSRSRDGAGAEVLTRDGWEQVNGPVLEECICEVALKAVAIGA